MKKRSNKILIFLGILIALFTSCDTFEKGRIFEGLSGAWSCQENSVYSGYRKYLIEFDKYKSQDNLFIISNFHNLGNTEFIFANYSGDSVIIENQAIAGIFVNGTGIVNEEFNELELSYETDDGSIQIQYFAVYSR